MAYNNDALKRGINQSKVNIVTFEEAIEKERNTIREYYRMIEHNEEQARIEIDKKAHIEIDNG